MLIPVPILARVALGAGLALTLAAVRIHRARSSVARDDTLDETPDGLAVRAETLDDTRQATASARWRRVLRLGRTGPGVEVDLTGLARGRVRRAPPP